MTNTVDMKDLVALCKRRGFIFPASEIYGGINGFWDYGPLGTELKNNLRDMWWKWMVTTPPIGPDGGFNDPMVDCRESKKRYRADHLVVLQPRDTQDTPWIALDKDDTDDDLKKRLKKLRVKGLERDVTDYIEANTFDKIDSIDMSRVIGPDASMPGTLTEPRQFNMMFQMATARIIRNRQPILNINSHSAVMVMMN